MSRRVIEDGRLGKEDSHKSLKLKGNLWGKKLYVCVTPFLVSISRFPLPFHHDMAAGFPESYMAVLSVPGFPLIRPMMSHPSCGVLNAR
jgi:hypothetical protein